MRYNTPNTPLNNFRDFVYRGGAPVTMGILIANAITFFFCFFFQSSLGAAIYQYLSFHPTQVMKAPWSLLTYPLVVIDPLSLLLSGFFFWMTGGSLERSWGSQRFARIFLALTAISALSVLIGYLILSSFAIATVIGTRPLMGIWMPLAAIIVGFCMINPEETISFFFIPVKAKYVALITVIFTWFPFGPALGFFACGGLLAAYLYVRFGRGWGSIGSYSAPSSGGRVLRMDEYRRQNRTHLDGSPKRNPFDLMGWWRARQEQKRLDKLFRNSGLTDRSPEWRDDDRRG